MLYKVQVHLGTAPRADEFLLSSPCLSIKEQKESVSTQSMVFDTTCVIKLAVSCLQGHVLIDCSMVCRKMPKPVLHNYRLQLSTTVPKTNRMDTAQSSNEGRHLGQHMHENKSHMHTTAHAHCSTAHAHYSTCTLQQHMHTTAHAHYSTCTLQHMHMHTTAQHMHTTAHAHYSTTHAHYSTCTCTLQHMHTTAQQQKVLACQLGRDAIELLMTQKRYLLAVKACMPACTRVLHRAQKQGPTYACRLPYSAGHAIQCGILPCPGKAKVTDLDEGRLLAVKQCVVQLHVAASGANIQVTCLRHVSSAVLG